MGNAKYDGNNYIISRIKTPPQDLFYDLFQLQIILPNYSRPVFQIGLLTKGVSVVGLISKSIDNFNICVVPLDLQFVQIPTLCCFR